MKASRHSSKLSNLSLSTEELHAVELQDISSTAHKSGVVIV